MNPPCVFGHKDEWEYFCETYEKQLNAITEVHEIALGLLLKAKSETTEQRVILQLAGTCLKEFDEILLLCGNGFGSGGLKLLRTLYERTITLAYLAGHTDEIQQYIDYSDVHMHKLLMEAQAAHPDKGDLSPEAEAKIKDKYAAVRERFLQEDCKKCQTTRLMGSWTKKNLPALSKDADPILRQFYFRAFLRPTLYSHTTFIGTMWQTDTSDGGLRLFGTKIEHESADDAISKAHFLLIESANVTNNFFQLGKEESINGLFKVWGECWKNGEPPIEQPVQ